MKNIYLLPTDKPSRLFLNKVNNKLLLEDISNPSLKKVLPSGSYQNIYITSDEEIKEGDWLIVNDEDVMQMKSSYDNDMNGEDIWVGDSLNGYATYKDNCKKIILTTDQALSKNGVQAIDDDFLEWFLKNISCEYVEVEIKPMFPMYSTFIEFIDNPPFYGNLERKIIIPQEEPKQETLEEAAERILEENYAYTDDSGDRVYYDTQVKQCIIDGAKWQAERSYSEEEVLNILQEFKRYLAFGDEVTHSDWFAQFKK
jgi:hypothetical protein